MTQGSEKSEGITKSERYLAALAKRSFLSPWSHPNLFRDQSKELADLIVVCHNKVIIFSDKYIKFNEDIDLKIAWQRWYNKAVIHAVKQLRRAHNWLLFHPDRVFSDSSCNDAVDLFHGVKEELEVHLVAVANGAAPSCVRFFGSGSGSLIVCPTVDATNPPPFQVGMLRSSLRFLRYSRATRQKRSAQRNIPIPTLV